MDNHNEIIKKNEENKEIQTENFDKNDQLELKNNTNDDKIKKEKNLETKKFDFNFSLSLEPNDLINKITLNILEDIKKKKNYRKKKQKKN